MEGEKQSFVQSAKEFFSGCFAGVCQVMMGQPFDIIKVRLQNQKGSKNQKNMVQIFKEIVKKEGIHGFYKGTLSPLMGVGASTSIQFGVNKYVQRGIKIIFNVQDLNFPLLFTAGAIAGACNSSVSTIVEHVRIRMQIQTKGSKKVYPTTLKCYEMIFKVHGVKGLYRGMCPCLLREMLGYGCYFGFYDWLLNRLTYNQIESATTFQILMGGSLGGITFWGFSFPLDTIKTKYQTDNLKKPVYKNIIQAFRKEISSNGVKSLYKGFQPCMLRSIPINAGTFLAFELSLKAIGGKKKF